MAGHSKWSQIKHAKGANDKKRSAMFTKLSKNISLAAKQGKDPEMNPALRTAIDAAKQANMPKDNIERAVLRGAGELPGLVIEEVVYECYGPGGVAILLECATDNTNRTSQHLKTALSKNGGSLGGAGSVSYLFERKGVVRADRTDDEMQLAAMDAGADDIVEEDGGLTIYCTPDAFEDVKAAVQSANGVDISYANVDLVPSTTIPVSEQDETALHQLLEILEENEDVIESYHNAKFSE